MPRYRSRFIRNCECLSHNIWLTFEQAQLRLDAGSAARPTPADIWAVELFAPSNSMYGAQVSRLPANATCARHD